jgi:asparagine synthase (glutamine-hydrolysing)
MDIRLVDYLLAIPPVPWFVDKNILRETMRNILPEAVRQRPKTPAAGEPVVELSRAFESRLGSFEPSSELSRFADVTVLRQEETGSDNNVWLRLRMFALNRWLEHSTGSPFVGSAACYHKSMNDNCRY